MGFEVDDIEDIIGGSSSKHDSSPPLTSHLRRNNSAPSRQSTVRIRRLRQPNKSDCDNGCCDDECCGDSTAQSLDALFDESQPRDDRFKNGCVSTEEVVRRPTTQQASNCDKAASNDLVPSHHTVYLRTWGCSHNNSDSEYMAGLLAKHGFKITTSDYNSSSVVVLNSCTVKGPSEQHFRNEIDRALAANKKLVLAGCVPQSDRSYRTKGSVIGVQQIDRIVEVVEETLLGNKLSYVGVKRRGPGVKAPGAALALPKIRKNELVEIVPISTGCLNNCTYCKTKLARGQLASYSIESIRSRIEEVTRDEGIREVWLTSEDLGAWGIDLGLTIVDLLKAIVAALPKHVMLRLGMTNPPYILDHLEEISSILSHPNVYEFLHIPVQSGSDSVLLEMKREYCRKEFQRICDFMLERHPRLTVATDIICGYPTETESDFEETYRLVAKYKFPVLFINQFYPRSGTVAAKLPRIPTHVVKARTKRLNDLFLSYRNLDEECLVGSVQRVLLTEIAHDGVKLVGHNKNYQQVLVEQESSKLLGEWVDVTVRSVGKFSMIGGDAKVVGDDNYYHHQTTRNYLTVYLIIICAVIVLVVSYTSCRD